MESLMTIIRRRQQAKGYGVQSPNDYNFIRNVIREKHPYYDYQRLARLKQTRKQRKQNELLFRIANHCQPKTIVVSEEANPIAARYMAAGCRTAVIGSEPKGEKALLLTDIHDADTMLTETLQDGSIIVMTGIDNDKETKKQWHEMKKQMTANTVFDLKRFAVIIIDRKTTSKQYMITI